MDREEEYDIYVGFLQFMMENHDLPNCGLKIEDVKAMYVNYMKIQPISNKKFEEVLRRLYYHYIIWQIQKPKVIFSHKLMLSMEYNHLGSHKDFSLIENRYLSSNFCKLCNERFQGNKKHKQDERHLTRVLYLTKKIGNDDNIMLLDKESNQLKKIKFEQRIRNAVKIMLMNDSTSTYKILDIFQLNTHFDINLDYLYKLPFNCKPKTEYSLKLNCTFQEPQDFSLLLGIIMENSSGITRVVKKINIKVKRSLTDQYIKPPMTRDGTDEIIPGVPLPENNSPFVPVNKLKLYLPKGNTLKILEEMAEKTPVPRKKCSVNNSQELYVTKKNYERFFHHLLYEEELQMRKDIKMFNTKAPLEFVNGYFFRLQVPGLAESRPSLIRGDSVYVKEKETSSKKFEGIVHKVEKSSVLLGFDSRVKPFAIKNLNFHIEFSFNRFSIKVEHTACKLVTDHQFSNFLFPELRQLEYSKYLPNYFNRELNEKQRIAVANILNSPQNSQPYLIFGPPGTGKTSTLVELIRQIHKNEENSRILVCGPSNSAVDELALRLLVNIPKSEMLRFVALSYSRSLKNSPLEDIINKKHGEFYIPTIEDLQRFRIVLTTTINAARFYIGGVKPKLFSYVIIDEAGYLTETETLVPLAGVLTSQNFKGEVHGKLVLAGDPRQLGPRIHSKTAEKYGFGVSLIERLIDSCDLYQPKNNNYNEKYITLLEMNYRSHKEILKVPNELFYKDKLIAAEKNFSMLFNNWEGLPTKGFPIIFHNEIGEDARDRNSPSFYNAKEVQQVVNYIKTLLDAKLQGKQITQADIGVITPYRKQIEKIHAETSKNNWNKILVGTVEQFQGKERTIIIISAVRSKKEMVKFDKTFDLGFLANPKRFNVAVTRAKSLVILIGNGTILQHDKYWRRYIEYCIQNKSALGKKVIFTESTEDFENINGVINESVDFSRGNM